MARITNLFNEKVYIFSGKKEVYENEKNLIIDLMHNHDLGNVLKVDFIDANLNNDVFSVETEIGKFCVKLSLDSESSNLQKEFKILQKNIGQKISTFPIAYGIENSVEYSITAMLQMPNVMSAGVLSVVDQEHALPFFFKQLNGFAPVEGVESVSEYLDSYIDFDILKVPDAETDWIKNHGQIRRLISEEILYLQNILRSKKNLVDFSSQNLCHGNLNQSTLLILGDYIHAINWENAYIGDPLLDLLSVRYELFFSEKFEDSLIKKYYESINQSINEPRLHRMRMFARYFNLLKIMVDYLKEVYVLKAYKKNKILNCAIKFSKNYDSFYQLPSFDKKLKPIAEFFVSSVI